MKTITLGMDLAKSVVAVPRRAARRIAEHSMAKHHKRGTIILTVKVPFAFQSSSACIVPKARSPRALAWRLIPVIFFIFV